MTVNFGDASDPRTWPQQGAPDKADRQMFDRRREIQAIKDDLQNLLPPDLDLPGWLMSKAYSRDALARLDSTPAGITPILELVTELGAHARDRGEDVAPWHALRDRLTALLSTRRDAKGRP